MVARVAWLDREFEVFKMEGAWRDVAGVYIFTGLNRDGLWTPIYVGETVSFSDRMPGHERWAEAVRYGATHVHAVVVAHEAIRRDLERRLIAGWQPPLNTQLR